MIVNGSNCDVVPQFSVVAVMMSFHDCESVCVYQHEGEIDEGRIQYAYAESIGESLKGRWRASLKGSSLVWDSFILICGHI